MAFVIIVNKVVCFSILGMIRAGYDMYHGIYLMMSVLLLRFNVLRLT